MSNFIPPLPLGQFAPSSETIASWLYQIWQYLQAHPIPDSANIETEVSDVVSDIVPPMIQTAIGNIEYAQFVDGSTLPVYRAANDEIDNQDLLEAWNEGCRFALVDDELFYVMIKNGERITLFQLLTEAQSSGVVSVNGQTGAVVLEIPSTSNDIDNVSNISGLTLTDAFNTINTRENTFSSNISTLDQRTSDISARVSAIELANIIKAQFSQDYSLFPQQFRNYIVTPAQLRLTGNITVLATTVNLNTTNKIVLVSCSEYVSGQGVTLNMYSLESQVTDVEIAVNVYYRRVS